MVSTCASWRTYLHDILDLGHVGPAVVGEDYSRHVGGIVAIQGYLGFRKTESDAKLSGTKHDKKQKIV